MKPATLQAIARTQIIGECVKAALSTAEAAMAEEPNPADKAALWLHSEVIIQALSRMHEDARRSAYDLMRAEIKS